MTEQRSAEKDAPIGHPFVADPTGRDGRCQQTVKQPGYVTRSKCNRESDLHARATPSASPEADRAEIDARRTRHAIADVVRAHVFLSSRVWPDGSEPVAPDWNPGCTCGASHYYFEHDLHVADALLTAGVIPPARTEGER